MADNKVQKVSVEYLQHKVDSLNVNDDTKAKIKESIFEADLNDDNFITMDELKIKSKDGKTIVGGLVKDLIPYGQDDVAVPMNKAFNAAVENPKLEKDYFDAKAKTEQEAKKAKDARRKAEAQAKAAREAAVKNADYTKNEQKTDMKALKKTKAYNIMNKDQEMNAAHAVDLGTEVLRKGDLIKDAVAAADLADTKNYLVANDDHVASYMAKIQIMDIEGLTTQQVTSMVKNGLDNILKDAIDGQDGIFKFTKDSVTVDIDMSKLENFIRTAEGSNFDRTDVEKMANYLKGIVKNCNKSIADIEVAIKKRMKEVESNNKQIQTQNKTIEGLEANFKKMVQPGVNPKNGKVNVQEEYAYKQLKESMKGLNGRKYEDLTKYEQLLYNKGVVYEAVKNGLKFKETVSEDKKTATYELDFTVYQKDEKGNQKVDEKGNPIVDEAKTEEFKKAYDYLTANAGLNLQSYIDKIAKCKSEVFRHQQGSVEALKAAAELGYAKTELETIKGMADVDEQDMSRLATAMLNVENYVTKADDRAKKLATKEGNNTTTAESRSKTKTGEQVTAADGVSKAGASNKKPDEYQADNDPNAVKSAEHAEKEQSGKTKSVLRKATTTVSNQAAISSYNTSRAAWQKAHDKYFDKNADQSAQ